MQVEPDLLVSSAERLTLLADALGSAAASVPALPPEPGFGSGTAAADLEADLIDAVRGHAERARHTAGAVRAAAASWLEADATAAASFAG
ncbi:hypothetical protein PSA01_42720 [Pseudonocardia saturnea]|uniref:Excreted virulence factor EspC (Type VII ESX diderm) n=1 Tax=Pseudonocardia saturnea TaxID=33909 RepID=A0ABQ0S2W1_9PSEU|nr:hypothetical protein Pdca_46110 [Pseudonocardia autotrophica]GEC27243.1 hypothetical protein PSA01_42720 [Pseudonocardia saturnea]